MYLYRNVKLGVHSSKFFETTVAVAEQKLLHISVCVYMRVGECMHVRVCVCVWCMGTGVCLHACSLTYPASKAPPYCHIRSLWFHHIFRHYLINDAIFGEKVTEHKMCALVSSTVFIWNISLSKYNLEKYCQACENIFMRSYCRQILTKFDFSLQIFFLKSSNIKFYENPSSESRVVPCGRTDGRTDMTQLIVAFRNFAKGA